MKKEELVIGKRYKFSPWVHGDNKWKNGILSGFTDKGAAIIVTRDNIEWEVYNIQDLELFKK